MSQVSNNATITHTTATSSTYTQAIAASQQLMSSFHLDIHSISTSSGLSGHSYGPPLV